MQEAAKHLAKSRATDREEQVAALQEASDRISRFVQAHSLMDQDPAAAVMLCQQLLQEAPEQLVRAVSECCLQVGETHSTSLRRQHNWSIRTSCTRAHSVDLRRCLFTESMARCCCVTSARQGPIPDLAVGDVYGLLIEYSINAQGNMQQALQLVEQMMDRHLSPGQHLGPEVFAAVQQVSRRPAACPAPLGSICLMQIRNGCVGLALIPRQLHVCQSATNMG